MIKWIAFDLDGTIGDTIPLCINALKKAVEPYVLRKLSKEEIVQTFGLNEEGMIKQVAGKNWKKALDDFYIHYAHMHQICPHPFNGIQELIQELRKNKILIALITGKGQRSCEITLDQFGMNTCFDYIETGSPKKNRKSEAINSLLEKYHLHPNEILYIGDTESDVLSCKETGIECLSAAWAKGSSVERLEQVNAGNVIPSVSALKNKLITYNIFTT